MGFISQQSYNGQVAVYRYFDSVWIYNYAAQTFTVSSEGLTVERLAIRAYKTGSPDNATIKILGTTDNKPNDSDVKASTNWDVSSVTTDTDGEWYEFNLSANLTEGVYAIVLYAGDWNSINDNVNWKHWNFFTDIYADGKEYIYSYLFEQWQVNEISPAHIDATFQIGTSVPSKPTNPTPANEATEVDWSDKTISWEDGGGATSYDVYFWQGSDWISLGNTEDTSYVVPYTTEVDEEGTTHAYINETEMSWNVEFYWRIDAVNDAGTTTGDQWQFDARPAKVATPTPENEDTDISLFPEYSWDASTVATSYDLYVGIDELLGDYSIDVLGLTDVSYDSAVVDFENGQVWGYGSLYLWRVDAANEFGSTEGDVWTFTSISFAPPLPDGITLTDTGGAGNGEGTPTGTPTGLNNMITIKRLCAAARNTFFYESI